MKTVTARELHLRTAAILKETQEGETIVVTLRGRKVAEIHPPSQFEPGTAPMPDLTEWRKQFHMIDDTDEAVSEIRS
ncbi:MAG: type II toxin-antitoxin system Phd/YefM family antitoxin [Candidatus Solibacter usitatus]|nr:type II toxin-antitoxin system Phd/YefM family antitoxin [Candidatus Solibacter usitatus]